MEKLSDNSCHQEKKQSTGKCVRNILKSLDRYGIPVSLTYKKQPVISSVMGGVFTILARAIVIAYLCLKCQNVLNKSYTVQTSQLKRDLTKDNTIYNLTHDNFDFAVYLDWANKYEEPDVWTHIDEYVDLRVSQNVYTWGKDKAGYPQLLSSKKLMKMVPCQKSRLHSNVSHDYLGIYSNYLCPEKVDFFVQGMFSAEQSGFIQIAVRQCSQKVLDMKYNGTRKCKPPSESDRISGHLKLTLIFQNSYFKDDEFEDSPIKFILKSYYFSAFQNQSQYYYMLLSKNLVDLYDSPIFNKASQESFIETKVDYEAIMEVPDGYGTANAYVSAYLMMDYSHSKTIRRVTTFGMVFSETGGFMTLIFLITAIVVSRLQDTIYYTTLIKSFYKEQELPLEESENEQKVTGFNTFSDLDKSNSHLSDVEKYLRPQEKIMHSLKAQIAKRKKVIYTLSDQLVHSIRSSWFCCCRTSTKDLIKRNLYEKALSKIGNELDIRHINNELRNLKFVANILLTKYQRQMIPFFRDNIVQGNSNSSKVNEKLEENFDQNLQQVLKDAKRSKLNQRIIKNVNFNDDEVLKFLDQVVHKEKHKLSHQQSVQRHRRDHSSNQQHNSKKRHIDSQLNEKLPPKMPQKYKKLKPDYIDSSPDKKEMKQKVSNHLTQSNDIEYQEYFRNNQIQDRIDQQKVNSSRFPAEVTRQKSSRHIQERQKMKSARDPH